jgi:hypothetical protein
MAESLTIENLLPDRLSAGIITQRGLSLRSAPLLQTHIAAQLDAIRSAHAAALPPGFAMSRRLYKSVRVDPTKHRPSSEALWRRLRERNDFPAVNAAVDLTNLLALKFQICYVTTWSASRAGRIALGGAGDRYQIRKELQFRGKIVLRDELGAGNPSADSRASGANEPRYICWCFFIANDPSGSDPGRYAGRVQ